MRKTLVKRPYLPKAAPDHSEFEMDNRFTSFPANMPRKLMQIVGVTAGLALSTWGYAAGLGGINVESSLGQPLKAEIELSDVSKSDKQGLLVRLASPENYKNAGLDYPYGIKYNFKIEYRADGQAYIRLSSSQAISDPFVSLLVELSWASGKLVREYTFLLDPPGYVPEQPKEAQVQPVAPVAPAVKSEKLEAPSTPAPVEKPVMPQAKPVPRYAAPVKQVEPGTGSAITVKSGDTLDRIASRVKPQEVSLERMLVALYRANTDQFDGNNMNRIRTGKILHVPDSNALANLSQTEAVQEIHAQAEDWNAYRQKLAGAASASRHEGGGQLVKGKITSADKAPVASESAKEVLRLSRGEAPGDKSAAAGKSKSAQKNAAAEEAIAKAKAVEDEKARAALLEKNLQDMKRLAELKSEAAAAASKVAAASSVAPASAVAAASAVQPASAVSPASAVKPAKPVKPAVVEEPSLMDQLLASPIYMGIGAALLVALGALGMAAGRRKKAAALQPAEDVGVITGQLTSPVAPSPDTGDFTEPAVHEEEAVHQPDDVDPISEADLFLNFGRDEQAEEVLKDALQHSPDNHQLHLKLLGIYADRQDAAAFENIDRMLRDTGDSEAIQQAEVLRQKLSNAAPQEEARFEDTDSATQLTPALDEMETASVTDEHETLADEREEPGAIDFDVTQPTPEAITDFDVAKPLQKEETDFDLTRPLQEDETDLDVTSIMPQGGMDFDVTSDDHISGIPLDFDIAAKQPEQAEQHKDEALPILDDLIFDVTSSPVEKVAVESPVKEVSGEGNEFMLDFPLEKDQVKTPPAIDLSDINLDMNEPAETVETAEGEHNEHWHEVATKLDLAKAYQEMGDEVGAREILDEVMQEGDKAQQQEARLLISQLG